MGLQTLRAKLNQDGEPVEAENLTSFVRQAIAPQPSADAPSLDRTELVRDIMGNLHSDRTGVEDDTATAILKALTEAVDLGQGEVGSRAQQVVAKHASQMADADDPIEVIERRRYQAWVASHHAKTSVYDSREAVDEAVQEQMFEAERTFPVQKIESSFELLLDLLGHNAESGELERIPYNDDGVYCMGSIQALNEEMMHHQQKLRLEGGLPAADAFAYAETTLPRLVATLNEAADVLLINPDLHSGSWTMMLRKLTIQVNQLTANLRRDRTPEGPRREKSLSLGSLLDISVEYPTSEHNYPGSRSGYNEYNEPRYNKGAEPEDTIYIPNDSEFGNLHYYKDKEY